MYLNNINFTGKNVILRVDFNVPLENNIITSDKRILAALPTIDYILNSKANRLIIISHLGRPKGIDIQKSLLPVYDYLGKIYKNDISFTSLHKILMNKSNNKRIILLENIRFYSEETAKINDSNKSKILEFRKKLSSLGDVFVNDAFGCCHRAHSSIVGISTPEKCMGLLIEKEMKYLKDTMKLDGHKTLILGGSKVTDKIKLINNLIPKMDTIIIGGAMVFTFYKYLCFSVGNSLVDEEGIIMVKDILDNAKLNNTKIVLPIDFVGSTEFSEKGIIQTFDIKYGINDNYMGLDIEEKSIDIINKNLSETDIVFWNGPLGVFEMKRFENGSRKVMEFIAKNKINCVIGGGDTAACCEKFKLEKYMTHVSTGGGASLELLEGKTLPGIEYIK